jgi:endonuclease-3
MKDYQTIFKTWQKLNPHPQIELTYTTPFELLVATILSAQATDAGVNKATPGLFQVANTPEAILTLGIDGLKSYIKTIGLYPSKAKHIMAMCQLLIERHGGKVPHSREALEALPGVGRKTANVMLNTLWDEPVIAVDTHVYRVSRRMGFSKGETPIAVEKDLMKVIPLKFLNHAAHWLVLHGRYTCVARKPKCDICPVSKFCDYIKIQKKGALY